MIGWSSKPHNNVWTITYNTRAVWWRVKPAPWKMNPYHLNLLARCFYLRSSIELVHKMMYFNFWAHCATFGSQVIETDLEIMAGFQNNFKGVGLPVMGLYSSRSFHLWICWKTETEWSPDWAFVGQYLHPWARLGGNYEGLGRTQGALFWLNPRDVRSSVDQYLIV